jgi:hypothetical protein
MRPRTIVPVIVLPALLVIGAVLIAVVAQPAEATGRGPIGELVQAYLATAKFQDVARAEAAGYGKFTDAAGIACIDKPGAGGMGTHYVNGALVSPPDATLDPARPEALVYETRPDGRLRLVATEYIVFADAWDALHNQWPRLFGQKLTLVGGDNRYGIPPFYELHVWLWKWNPRGLFDDWNPRVTCEHAS